MLLLLGWPVSVLVVVPKKWSRARRPRLRYCLLNPIFILIICNLREEKKSLINKIKRILISLIDQWYI